MTPEQAISVVASALGETPVSAERMTFTHSGNVIYSVKLPNREVILRANSTPGALEYNSRNIKIMRSLGLPVPIIEAEGTSSLPELWKYVILEKLTGRDLYYELAGMSSAHITRLAEQIVSFQHKVSALPWGRDYGWGQIRVGGGEPTWFYVFHSPQEAAAPVSDGTSLMQMRARVHARKVSLQPYLRTVQPVCFLDDLTTKNVLIHRGELSGIIDFDCVCFGDPLWTIGATAGCIVSDIGIEHLFYFEELCRIADVSCVQRQAVELYAAERALFFLDAAVADRDDARAARLIKAIEMWTVK